VQCSSVHTLVVSRVANNNNIVVRSFGHNFYGQLGLRDYVHRSVPNAIVAPWQRTACTREIIDKNSTTASLYAISCNSASLCDCDRQQPTSSGNGGIVLRPDTPNGNWGGVGHNTCNAPSQSIFVSFERGVCRFA
jgi:hypothetical protein